MLLVYVEETFWDIKKRHWYLRSDEKDLKCRAFLESTLTLTFYKIQSNSKEKMANLHPIRLEQIEMQAFYSRTTQFSLESFCASGIMCWNALEILITSGKTIEI